MADHIWFDARHSSGYDNRDYKAEEAIYGRKIEEETCAAAQ